MLEVATIVLWVFGIGCVLVVALLFVLRLSFAWMERRTEARSARLRHLFFTYLMGEGREAVETERHLIRLRGRQWRHAEEQAFGMLPKLRGESRDQLVALLRSKGAVREALEQAHSWSAVRRCRGAFALGQVGSLEHAPTLRALLHDPTFLVRRVAVRALGSLGDGEAVTELLQVAREEPRMSRDVISALYRIGPEAVPDLREEVRAGISDPDRVKSGALSAAVLGLLGDYRSGGLLSEAARSGHPTLGASAAEALGAVTAPDSEPVLIECLSNPSVKVRAAAAQALASMGSEMSIPHLIAAVDREEPSLSREAAGALVKLGVPGREALTRSSSRYAREALALADLKAAR